MAWRSEFGTDGPSTVGSLMGEVVDRQMSAKLSANQRAAAAWYRANGDRERSHTTGVFLKRPRVHGAPPILGVYVDSHAMVTDMGVNKELYLARLANIGFHVSGIDFLPSGGGHAPTKKKRKRKAPPVASPLPELSREEQDDAEQLVSGLPDELRAKALKAVTLSKRREKLETAKKYKQR